LDVTLNHANLEIIIQNRCIETWLLGNQRFFKEQPQSEDLQRYINHYNVSQNDPELMPLLDGFTSPGRFHKAYLKSIFKERNCNYSETRPGQAGDETYFDELQKRVYENPTHLQTFSAFLQFCRTL